MEFSRTVRLKDGRDCLIRSGTEQDAQAVLACFVLTHGQTDELLSYPEEISFTEEQEAEYLRARAASRDEIELVAQLDGRIAGLAGVDRVGRAEKLRHRAGFGISLDRAFWGLGIGRAMTRACIECAKAAGYRQLELEVLADNARAIALYESEGFREYGRNPRGFCSRVGGMRELVLMRRELDG